MNTRSVGALYEERAVKYLENMGYRILARNYRCKIGEVDIVAYDQMQSRPVLTFVEVKYRRGKRAGYPEESVTPKKQMTIRRVAEFFLVKHRVRSNVPCRFDVIVFEGARLRHIQNAF